MMKEKFLSIVLWYVIVGVNATSKFEKNESFRDQNPILYACDTSLGISELFDNFFCSRENGVNCSLPDTFLYSKDEGKTFFFDMKTQTEEQKCAYKSVTLNSDQNGYFLLNGYLKQGEEFLEYYAPDEFCIESFTTDQLKVQICPTNCDDADRPCLKKCCSPDKVYSTKPQDGGCRVPSGNKFFYPSYYEDYRTKLSQQNYPKRQPHYFESKPSTFRSQCFEQSILMVPYSEAVSDNLTELFADILNGQNFHSWKFSVRADGSIIYKDFKGRCVVHEENICVDGIQHFGADGVQFENLEDEMIIFLCAHPNPTSKNEISIVFGALMIPLSIFPLLTTIVYLLLWGKQNAHGKAIVSTSASLFFHYVLTGTAHLLKAVYGRDITNKTSTSCVFIAIASHFFQMAVFAWLTVMSFDLWMTFRSLSPSRQKEDNKKFYIYSLFGWGIPTVFTVAGLVIESIDDNCAGIKYPGYGVDACWIMDESLGVYIHYPGVILLSINFALFSITLTKLCRYQQRRSRLVSKTDARKQCFLRFSKLFIVTGLTWIFEFISYFVHGLGQTWYWTGLDTLNILRAVGVFVIYVCKKDTIHALKESHSSLKCVLTFMSACWATCCCRESGRSQSNTRGMADKDFTTTTGLVTGSPRGATPSPRPQKKILRESDALLVGQGSNHKECEEDAENMDENDMVVIKDSTK